MPALTEQQRDESIIECEHIIANQDSYKGWLINMAKITLAALTSKPQQPTTDTSRQIEND